MNTERKLATIHKIEEIKPIEGADAIEAARVGGWCIRMQTMQVDHLKQSQTNIF